MEELWEVLRPEEQIELKLRKLYTQHHFHPYHLNNFEEYGDYQQNYNFCEIPPSLLLLETMVGQWH